MRQSMDDVRNKTVHSSGHEQYGTLQFQKDTTLFAPNIFTGATKLDYSTISTQKEANDKAYQRNTLAKF